MSKHQVCGIDALAMTLATGQLRQDELSQIESCRPGFADDLAEVLGEPDRAALHVRIRAGNVADSHVVSALRRTGGMR